ncbi:predicted protein [Nematostella vectensis]|uniref:G-protein coupled receptors family 1 profile domain-containing protein n=1 Tax=Nematostella vectensis TaxID=45351 RepID=A7SIK4_NEMVE|nr:predicted protein [Nematostella vectensis]|eukprot:XP_001628549.1 predicted protein [Nematostella vectensis]
MEATNTTYFLAIAATALRSRSKSTIIAESVFLFVINISALVGNSLILWLILRSRTLRRAVTNTYLIALAFSDLLMSILVMPMTLSILITGKWVLGPYCCKLQGFSILVLAWASLHIMALTALNRYFRVVRSVSYKKRFTRRFAALSIIIVLIIAVILALLPTVLRWSEFTFRPDKVSCFITFYPGLPTIKSSYTSFLLLVYTVIPMVTIIFCYFKVFRNVRRHVNSVQPSLGTRSAMNGEELQVTNTLFAIVLGFLTCWLPVVVIELLNAFLGTASLPRWVYLVYIYLVYVSNVINALVYGIMNRTFRRQARSLIGDRSVLNGAVGNTVATGVNVVLPVKTDMNTATRM